MELADDSALRNSHEVFDLLLVEQLAELEADKKNLAFLLSGGLTVCPSTARSWHRISRIV
jgi:hypothetical protein